MPKIRRFVPRAGEQIVPAQLFGGFRAVRHQLRPAVRANGGRIFIERGALAARALFHGEAPPFGRGGKKETFPPPDVLAFCLIKRERGKFPQGKEKFLGKTKIPAVSSVVKELNRAFRK